MSLIGNVEMASIRVSVSSLRMAEKNSLIYQGLNQIFIEDTKTDSYSITSTHVSQFIFLKSTIKMNKRNEFKNRFYTGIHLFIRKVSVLNKHLQRRAFFLGGKG